MTTNAARTARIALVGDRSPNVVSHTRIPGLLDALVERDRLVLDALDPVGGRGGRRRRTRVRRGVGGAGQPVSQ